MIYNGQALVLVEEETDFSPGSGFFKTQYYAGTEAALIAERDARVALGQTARIVNRGGDLMLRVSNPDPTGGSETDAIYDDWSIKTEFQEISVWSDEGLQRYLIANSIPNVTLPIDATKAAWALSNYRNQCNEFLSKLYNATGPESPEKEGPTPVDYFKPKYYNGDLITEADELAFLKLLYTQLALGMNKSRTARIVVRRRRTLKTASASRYTVRAGQLAWTTAGLIATFGPPVGFQALLPATPDGDNTPPGFTWGWALQDQGADTVGNGARAVETLEWVFAPCRNFTFTFNP